MNHRDRTVVSETRPLIGFLVIVVGLAGCQTPLEEAIEPASQPATLRPSPITRDTHSFPSPTGRTIVVNTTADNFNDDALTSLREAVSEAAGDPEPNRIVFDPAVFRAGSSTAIVLVRSILVGGSGDVIDGGGDGAGNADRVVLDGGGIPGSGTAMLALRAAGARLRSLTIGSVAGAAVLVEVSQPGGAAVGVESCRLVNCSVAGVFVNEPLGVPLVVTGTTFEEIGREAIDYPLSVRPAAPRVAEVVGNLVLGFAAANARVELFLDDAHLAGGYLGSTRAGPDGSFVVDLGVAPTGRRINATCRSPGGVTSSLRTLGGPAEPNYLAALLNGSGPLSEAGGTVDDNAPLLRWPGGTHLVIHLGQTLGGLFEASLRDFIARIASLTDGGVSAELRVGDLGAVDDEHRIVELLYVPPGSPELAGNEGRTFLTFAGGEIRSARVVVSRDSLEPGVGVHEMGHVLGLRHLCVNGQTLMNTSTCSGVLVTVHPEGATLFDALALRALYSPAVEPGDTLADLRALGLLP